MATETTRDTDRALHDRSVPFASVFAGTAHEAGLAIDLRAGDLAGPQAIEDLTHALVSRLSSIAARGLLTLFRQGRAPAPGGDDKRYRSFVATMAARPSRLDTELPVLAELVEMVTLQWQARTRQLLAELEADASTLRRELQLPGGPLVDRVACFLGDAHRNGASVTRLGHSNGTVWYHKPRPVDHEARFFDAMRGLQEHFGDPSPATTVIARNGYGWMGDLRPGRVADLDRYWRTAGRVAALAHMVGAVDLHHENVVATSSGPVPIDLECVDQPVVWTSEPVRPIEAAPALIDTVCATGLLPNHYDESGPVALELCGLLARPNQSGGEWRQDWVGLGTDAIDTTRRLSVWGSPGNRPLDEAGRPLPCVVDELVAGFEEGLAHLAGAGSSLVDREDLPSRVLLRETMAYVDQIGSLLAPEALADRAEFERRCGGLPPFPPVVIDQLGAGIEAVQRAERMALARLDVPLHSAVGDTLILDDSSLLPHVVRVTAEERAVHRRAHAVGPSAAMQAQLVRLAAEQHERCVVFGPIRGVEEPLTSAGADLDADLLLRAAVRLGEALVDEQLGTAEDPSWLEVRGAKWVRRGLIGDRSWYEGRAGIAVFFAALAAATGDTRWGHRALAALPAPMADDGPWFDVGRSGTAYAHALVGHLAQRPELLECAVGTLVGAAETTGRGDELDLINGWAGVLACHAAVFGFAPDDLLRARTERIADSYLVELDRQCDHPVEARGLLRAGLAHGITGIAHALDLVAHIVDDPSIGRQADRLTEIDLARTAEREGLAGRLDGSGRDRSATRTWCWGATGVLHAWASMGVRDPRAPIAVDRSLPALVDGSFDADHLCCGAAGRAVALDAIGGFFDRPEARRHGADLAMGLAERTLRGERFAILPDCSFQGTGLMFGRAGIGYALCRLALPLIVPDVLAFEPARRGEASGPVSVTTS